MPLGVQITNLPKKEPQERPPPVRQRLDLKVETLARTVLFGNLDAATLARLAGLTEWRVLAAGAMVFRKGDPGNHLFVVHNGRVKITSGAADGREVTLNLLGPAAVFGEVAFADSGVRTADAQAIEPVELLVLGRREFLPFLKADPEAMLQMMAALAARVRWISESYEDAAFMELPQRLAKRLLLLSRIFGFDTARGRRLGTSLPHRELAAHMNVTRESVNRLVQRWRKDGLIEEHRGFIVLRDIAGLSRIAGGDLPPQL